MLFPKKVKHRKHFTKRKNRVKEAGKHETRGVTVAFGSFGLKAMTYGRVTSNQIEAARKVMTRYATKSGKVWIRIFPDMPFTQKPAEVKMGKGKGDPVGFVAEVRPGRVMFEIDGVENKTAAEALRKAGTKLPVKTKVVARL
ncbi:MAG: 50S ribosomal protein L16 [Candidatus Taylorbacteria bacterium RIFCSPHIGHO2_02_FULL_45_28]|uniref:Large ribosomal subunit protein uL16 n=1 Tax=Candidatus Taylorbacteria bacterium RIFCSPHIGHO2_12_FULL_45_16 TaxID=1802315 RepID=A0A1G2N1B7_9BACT|nr:MAG: 50S ribosomal protein L16 [Candidatus Taylorbacteria bacterium RIFCSPHIGHO2_01_FULL_44_110]OHA25444.1 MAG: 50S ribosomal protein L16 [Candidatus Taylorbacteria bacterium RIFCSPHIGHO2_02_FULL_45_28]OHA29112.1 MAG: 50S ribosomal protein L16 [Candidatus Taylorbacteria bacterium RIFCSPHIGHO2_12_FULL_45_16]OHA33334.1 MAG: 50S ribosomal protein L16 [Candidatus Taylorbacteria bacterium RIFCSPLOWO2_01_FULL_45_59]OHA38753.1 MAG: 50S ribosomal protein L16 [Candidatus Taylorbacteria bacterium RIFC